MTILNLLLDLIDSLSLLSSLNPCARYPGEFLYWRLGGIILLAFVQGVWLFKTRRAWRQALSQGSG